MNIPVDKVIELARQGYTDSQIIKKLKQDGFSPKQINDAFNQAKIKLELNKTVAAPEPEMQSTEEQTTEGQEQGQDSSQEGYGAQAPEPSQNYVQEEQTAEAYPYQYPSYPSVNTNAEDVEELVQEVVDEKWQEFRKKTGNVEEVKDKVERAVTSFNRRLERAENSLNKLGQAASEKFKQHDQEIKMVKAEMIALRATIQKIMSPLMSHVKKQTGMLDVHHVQEKTSVKKETKIKTKKKGKPTIDDVFR